MLYELLAGRRAFGALTAQDELAAVLTRDPDWAAIPDTVPAEVVRLVKRCLQRDLSRRLRHIGDARLELEEIRASAGGREPVRRASRVRAWMLPVALLVGVALTLAVRAFVAAPADGALDVHATIFGVNAPPGESLYLFAGPVALSPDGTRVALVTNGRGGKPRIWLRSLSTAEPVPLDGADGGINPFWSPDGRSLAFFAGNELSVIDLASRAVRPIALWKGPLAGGSWSRDGVVLFADSTGLKRVPAAGGTVQQVMTPDSTGKPAVFCAAPHFLPDGRHYLYLAGNNQTGQGTVMLGTLDAPAVSAILSGTTMAIYVQPGYLIYVTGASLVAQRFNMTRLALEGDPQVLAEGAWAWSGGGSMAASASETGLMMFATRRSAITQLTWIDRSGRSVGTLAEPAEWVHVDASPDERVIAAERMDSRSGVGKIWTIDVGRDVVSLLTPDPEWRLAPVWSPDGSRIIFGASRNGSSNLVTKPADGGGAETPLYNSPDLKVPTDWTRDNEVIFNDMSGGGSDILSLPASGQGSPVPLVKGAFNKESGKVSPNGKWLAYVSNESGRPEIYVRDRAGDRRWQISRTGGSQPRWRRDGAELFYLSADSELSVARVGAGDSFSAGEPKALPIKMQPHASGWRYTYDVVNLGQRFLVSVPTTTEASSPITAVMNWTAALKRQ